MSSVAEFQGLPQRGAWRHVCATLFLPTVSLILLGCHMPATPDRLDQCKKEIERTFLKQRYLQTDVVLFTLTRGLLVHRPCPDLIIGLAMGEETVLEMRQSLQQTPLENVEFPKFRATFTISSINRYDENLFIHMKEMKEYEALPDRDGEFFIRKLGFEI